jgi:hypothetical protein
MKEPMKERSVGIRALKARRSECVREVKRGAPIVVTEVRAALTKDCFATAGPRYLVRQDPRRD